MFTQSISSYKTELFEDTLYKNEDFHYEILWPNPEETADLVTFTEEIRNGKLHFLCSVSS